MELSSKNSINNEKSLCLYCDKSFLNNLEQENHVERDHKAVLIKGKGSRKSERITKNNSSSENSLFPGCFHCNKKTFRTDDLDSLFKHLLSSHKNVYFGCKCKIRTQDKVSLASHKKICKISGGGKSTRRSDENVAYQKTVKKTQNININGDSKCDSDSDENISNAVAVASSNEPLPTNAIHKKSDRNKLKNHSKSADVNDKTRKVKSSSSSTISSNSSNSSNRTGEDEYTIPLTRQKLKEPTIVSKSGNRLLNNKKSQKSNKLVVAVDIKSISITAPTTKVQRTKTLKNANSISFTNPEPLECAQKTDLVSTDFEEDFYKNISDNIRLNLSCYVDGKSDRLQNRPIFDNLSEHSHVACCTTEKEVVSPLHEKEIHEATNFELSTPFPALLTSEQYGFGDSNPNKNKRQITKNSWKWKWDLIKKYKYVNEGGKIVKKVKQITNGLKDLSQLDMWTQLSMRSRYETLNNQSGMTLQPDNGLHETLSSRMIKTQNIEQLSHILDKCLTPEINIEQLQQTVIKMEPEEKEEFCESYESTEISEENHAEPEPLSMFNLVRTNKSIISKPLLSGEWARPRCYICLDCGLKFDLMKSLSDHKNSEHPYVVSAHYEIVGRENLEHKLYKNLFLPKKALLSNGFARSLSVNSDSKSNETNEASTSSDNSSKFFADQKEKECSKCLKMIKYSSDNDIYRHILDCIEDRVWLQAKRRNKYRRSRRKSRRTPRKSRLSVDQKKITSSPSTKDNTEGENSISNPPTPKNDLKSVIPPPIKMDKFEPTLNENKTVKGKNVSSDGMNIKNFFRVSKTTLSLPQKVVVQMLEIPPCNQSDVIRNSLRSSSAKKSESDNTKNDSLLKNDKARNSDVNLQSEPKSNVDVTIIKDDDTKNDVTEPEIIQESQNPLVPLIIPTPEKESDSQLGSSSNLSLISPTSCSNVPKKKKKLNDCIAMLTCKIQEKLGVNFFENSPAKVPSPTEQPSQQECLMINSEPKLVEVKVSKSFQIESLLKVTPYVSPEQDDVIDLSVKKKLTSCQCVIEEKEMKNVTNINHEVEQYNVQEATLEPALVEITKSEPDNEKDDHDDKIDETSIVPITSVSQCETVNNNISDHEDLKTCETEKKEIKQEQPVVVSEGIAEKIDQEITSDLSQENCDLHSFRISIPKDNIPNLKEILDQYQVITVNNIKISESERRAFEEQKNRILKILNKTNSLTRKITTRKVTTRKVVKRKLTGKLSQQKKKTEVIKLKTNAPMKKEADVKRNAETKIEEVIKTTNRIRCRRLSVVVDPIINLSNYQTKNRKMRLTNNSQQNGFYELLAASEKFFTDKNEKIVAPEEVEKPSEANKVDHGTSKLLPKSRIVKSAASKEPMVPEKAPDPETVDPGEQEPENKLKFEIAKEENHVQCTSTEAFEEKPTESKISPPTTRKGRCKKQNVENISSPVKNKKIAEINDKVKDVINEQAQVNQKKPVMRGNKKNMLPLEEIKVEQRVKITNSKDQLDKRKKLSKEKQLGKAQKLLDISFSSDTSNENDIPLAKLLTSTAEVQSLTNENIPEIIEINKDLKSNNKISKTSSLISASEVTADEHSKETSTTTDNKKSPTDVEEILASNEPAVKLIKKCDLEKHTSENETLKKNASSLELNVKVEVEGKKNYDPFTINEDSFFNDDLDNDPSDKINAIVNDIINSSEFQIDSDTEKSEVHQISAEDQKLPICSICKKTFRNQKVYDKHCTTSTHIMKVERKHRGVSKTKDKHVDKQKTENVKERAPSPILDDAKVIRTKGALKTFEQVLETPIIEEEKPKVEETVKPLHENNLKIDLSQDLMDINDDKLYYEFKMEKKPEDMTPKDKDQLFDSLFNSLEARTQESQDLFIPKSNYLTASPLDSEVENSSTSWNLKHEIEWHGDTTENLPFANAIKESFPKKCSVKINKSKETAISIPTKSLIMGKIFKKHLDREKQKTPQADAPSNKPGIKNSLDEIFDHLKNSAEIDDKVLTCPSPKTLLKNSGGPFSQASSNSKNMLETASQSNNNVYDNKTNGESKSEKVEKRTKANSNIEPQQFIELDAEDVDDRAGKRKSRRRCAIKAKTFAETWSSDEYEELHDTADIISIINEIEKRESNKKRKLSKSENHFEAKKNNVAVGENFDSIVNPGLSAMIPSEIVHEKDPPQALEFTSRDRTEKKKTVQTQFVDRATSSPKKRKVNSVKDGHKSDEETFTATRDFKPIKTGSSIKKRRMSCFVPSTTSFDDRPKIKHVREVTSINLKQLEKVNEHLDLKAKSNNVRKTDSEKSFKNQKRVVNLMNLHGEQQSTKKKSQKHRKRPRNKVKNIAYDSDSDFELNLNKKPKVSIVSESSGSEEGDDNYMESVVTTPKSKKFQPLASTSRSSKSNITMTKEPKLLQNDLKKVVFSTTTLKAAIPDIGDIVDSSQTACNRTKRHSSEKLYYWSSSSSESDQGQGDTADGDNEDSLVPHQPEQHGWIVGDSHKKLVTLLAHAKIKNKIN